MELSSNAKENGERYVKLTAQNTVAAVDGSIASGPNDYRTFRSRMALP
jgi:hypothetical protein